MQVPFCTNLEKILSNSLAVSNNHTLEEQNIHFPTVTCLWYLQGREEVRRLTKTYNVDITGITQFL